MNDFSGMDVGKCFINLLGHSENRKKEGEKGCISKEGGKCSLEVFAPPALCEISVSNEVTQISHSNIFHHKPQAIAISGILPPSFEGNYVFMSKGAKKEEELAFTGNIDGYERETEGGWGDETEGIRLPSRICPGTADRARTSPLPLPFLSSACLPP